MAKTELHCGPPGSGRSAAIDAVMAAHWGRAILLVPTHAYALKRREELILNHGLDGAWGAPVQQLTGFATSLLEGEGIEARRLGDFERRLLLESCLGEMEAGATPGLVPTEAGSPGVVKHLLRVIAQLKQAAIEADEFRGLATASGHTALDEDMATVYEAYQRALKDRHVYDVPGLYWQADISCRADKPKILNGIEALLLDGFDDFTRSEFRLLHALAPHLDRLVIGLNYDRRPGRADLYALPARTVAMAAKQLDSTVEHYAPPAPRRYSEFAAEHIFWRDMPPEPTALEPDLTILPCAGPCHEIETIARRVKKLLLDEDVRPGAIAIVYRNPAGTAETLRSVFEELGIPLRMSVQPMLSQSAFGAFVLRLLEALRGWRRDTVLDVLSSPWIDLPGAGPEDVSAFPLLARTAQIIGGYDEWLSRLGSLLQRLESARGADIQSLLRRLPRAAEIAALLMECLRQLKHLASQLPKKAPQKEHAEALDRLIDTLGVKNTIDAAALSAFRGLLETIAGPSGSAKPIPHALFAGRIEEGMRESPYPRPNEAGGVQVLDTASARNLEFDYVFFAGLTEGDTPAPPATNAVYSERGIERLRSAGVHLEGAQEHSERERLLFHHVLSMARKGLSLSWSVAKSGGAAAVPSPFLTEVHKLFGDPAIEEPMPRSDSFLPEPVNVMCLRDLRNVSFRAASPAAAPFADGFAPTCFAVAIEKERGGDAPFRHHDGVLGDKELRQSLVSEYGSRHEFSVSQLETYRACPFRFFAQRLLGVDETDEAEATLDPRIEGLILHDVLQAFHKRFSGRAIPEIPEDQAAAAMDECLGEGFEAHAWKNLAASPGVIEVARQRMAAMLQRYLRVERARDESEWKPSHFEASFGEARGEARDPLSLGEPFILETSHGPVRFAGRIDRIDLGGTGARIIDYKRGRVPGAGEIVDGYALQLSIYAEALEQVLLPGKTCETALYLPVGKDATQYREALGRNRKGYGWDKREENATNAVETAVAGIRAGHFPPTPRPDKSACAYCKYRAACRYEENRIARKGN